MEAPRRDEGNWIGLLRPAEIRLYPEMLLGGTSYTQANPAITINLFINMFYQRNMVDNGGLLDEIVFIAKTSDKDDLAYLEELLASNPKYSAQYHNRDGFDYSQMWGVCEKGNVYVKIDDDVVSWNLTSSILTPPFLLLADNPPSYSLKTPPSALLSNERSSPPAQSSSRQT